MSRVSSERLEEIKKAFEPLSVRIEVESYNFSDFIYVYYPKTGEGLFYVRFMDDSKSFGLSKAVDDLKKSVTEKQAV